MKRKPYPKYKPSGVEWLGDVPEHWEVKRGRFAMSVNPPSPQLRALEQDDEVSFVPMEAVGVAGGLNLEQRRFLAEISSGYTEFQDGDVVVAKITPCFDNGKAALACGLLNGAAYGTTELHVLRAGPSTDSSFLFYVAVSDTFRKLGESEMFGAGGQKRVPAEFCKDFRTPLPPLSEQRAIAAFLDRETGRIDTLIAKKRELVERLKEKRTALISHTVTHGLPPDAAKKAGLPVNPPLRPSGVEWLGDIPKHWEALTVRRRAKRIQTGGTPPTAEERYYEEGTVPWFGPGSFDDQIAVSQPVKLLNASATKEGAARMFAAGATMVVTIGATLGKVSSLIEAGSCNQQITVIEFDQRCIHPRFATYQLKRLEPALRAIAPSATLPILDQGEIADIAFGVPSLPEQAAIAAYLDAETAKLDTLVAKIEEAVERLQEYRTALITAAV
ncbi:MAG: restriction endonuclease subunit S, partial [Lentisphaerae bacterium]|nr:restriction endonuclease subunit S [Lentisphaerota bacterium]